MKLKLAQGAPQVLRTHVKRLRTKRNWTKLSSLIVTFLSWHLPRLQRLAFRNINKRRCKGARRLRGSSRRLWMGSSFSKEWQYRLGRASSGLRSETVRTRCLSCLWRKDLRSRKLTSKKKWANKFTQGSTLCSGWLKVKVWTARTCRLS